MEAANIGGVQAEAHQAKLAERLRLNVWTADAWMSIGVTALFIGITFWWLSQDRSIPVFDAGTHLIKVLLVYKDLQSGSIGTALTSTIPYPPVAYLVGSLGLWIGGVGVAQPVIAENLVFVPLLALGCYQVGRLAFGSRAGLLAVVFALGSPLITSQFHVFMIDAPESAMVAISVWLIIATRHFSNMRMCAAAGVAVGLGMLTKEPLVFFVAGVVIVTAIRGGWDAWRGFVVFSIIVLVITLPWYLNELTVVHGLEEVATHAGVTESGIAPSALSGANLMWYFWNILSFQIYAPLFAFAAIGGVWTIVGFARRRPVSPLALELTVGAFVAWFGITMTFVHDTRYSMPFLLYLAVFGSGWIVNIRQRSWRAIATGTLVLVAFLNMLGLSFGVGGIVRLTLPGSEPQLLNTPGLVTIYTNTGFLVSKPQRDGNVLALMRALRRHGAREVLWTTINLEEAAPAFSGDFSESGLTAFSLIAKLRIPTGPVHASELTSQDAILYHGPLGAANVPQCVELSDGTAIWVRIGNPTKPGAKYYCPYRHPAFY